MGGRTAVAVVAVGGWVDVSSWAAHGARCSVLGAGSGESVGWWLVTAGRDRASHYNETHIHYMPDAPEPPGRGAPSVPPL